MRGVAAELRGAGVPLVGAHLQISGTVARGSGLSSSAALEVAVALALVAVAGAPPLDRLALAELCSRAENEWVGAHTGLLDQIASLFGRAGAALEIDFRTLQIAPVALALGDWRLVTLDSGESHRLGDPGYNERRAECAQAAELLGVASLRDAEPAAASDLPEPLRARVLHVLGENERVRETAARFAGRRPGRGRARCSTAHTRVCATSTPSPPRRWTRPWRGCTRRARPARG